MKHYRNLCLTHKGRSHFIAVKEMSDYGTEMLVSGFVIIYVTHTTICFIIRNYYN